MSINEKLEIDPSDLPKSTWEKYGKPLLETKLIHLAKLIPAFSPFIDYLKSILDEQRLLRIESQLKEQGANLQALNL